MRPLFPKLGPVTVEVIDRAGAVYFVPMLPVRRYDYYRGIVRGVVEEPTPEKKVEGRRRLRALIATVWPPELNADLLRLDYGDCVTLADKLFFGESLDEERATSGKAPEADPDLEMLAARMLNIFPGYTLDTLLALPPTAFFRLQDLSVRIRADEALTGFLPAIQAALATDKTIVRDLEKLQGGYSLPPEGKPRKRETETLSPEKEAELDAQLAQILAGEYTVVDSLKAGMRVK